MFVKVNTNLTVLDLHRNLIKSNLLGLNHFQICPKADLYNSLKLILESKFEHTQLRLIHHDDVLKSKLTSSFCFTVNIVLLELSFMPL